MAIYDVAVVGAGVSGVSTAWQLSHYELDVVLLEKFTDVGFGVSKANSGIVHGGFHHSISTLKARLEIRGNMMFEKLQYELGFPFRRDGILVVAFSPEEMVTVQKLYAQGVANGVRSLEMCGHERLLQLEPKLNSEVVGGFFAPGGGTIEPYRYVFSMVESARNNGLEVRCDFEVANGRFDGRHWELEAADGQKIRARYVVNAAGLFADDVSRCCGAEDFKITPRKGEEYLLDRESPARPRRVIFPVPTRTSKGVLVIPTAEGTTMIGPTAEITPDKYDLSTSADRMRQIVAQVGHMVKGVSPRDIITSFAGMRAVLESEDFYIELSKKVPQFVQLAGIQSPGLTASPAIGEYVKDILKTSGLRMVEKSNCNHALPHRHEIRSSTPDELAGLHSEDPRWTRVICRCENISEAEIIAAVRHGHTTLDGVKFYTRAGMGRCQGGFCSARIMKIISRESGIPMTELTKRGGKSRLLAGKLGSLTVK